MWHTRLCLCTSSLEFVCFLMEKEAKTDAIDIVKVKPERLVAAELTVDADVDAVFAGLMVPVGGDGTDEELTAVVKSVTLSPQAGALSAAGTWRTYTRKED